MNSYPRVTFAQRVFAHVSKKDGAAPKFTHGAKNLLHTLGTRLPSSDDHNYHLAFGSADLIGRHAKQLLKEASRLLPFACRDKFKWQSRRLAEAATQFMLNPSTHRHFPAAIFLSPVYITVPTVIAKRGVRRVRNEVLGERITPYFDCDQFSIKFDQLSESPCVRMPWKHLLWAEPEHERLKNLGFVRQVSKREYARNHECGYDEYKTRFVWGHPNQIEDTNDRFTFPSFHDLTPAGPNGIGFIPMAVLTMLKVRQGRTPFSSAKVYQLNFALRLADSALLDVCDFTRDFDQFVHHWAGAEELFNHILSVGCSDGEKS